ncbi:MAG: histidinol dehydrogenase [Firmicutes bacterium]|nr:histidinol dehydrogenase [Bacillota bacterium]
MKIIKIKKGEELSAAGFLSNRTDSDFDEIDKSVREIIAGVKKDGDKALHYYSEKFGGPGEKQIEQLRVSQEEIDNAYNSVEPEFINTLNKAAANIRAFHEKQLQKTWRYEEGTGILLGQLIRPIKNVGVYVPGGTAPLFSSVLMNVIPAKIAGCQRIVMCTPAAKDGGMNKYILTAAKIAGADEIYKTGGAQAIAALAYGTESIKKVNKITGPGSAFVARAKKYVFGTVDIDMIAGPSEIAIIADDNADPEFLAADMLSQAEHDAMASSILITTSKDIAEKTSQAVKRQLEILERKSFAEKSIENNGAIFVTEDIDSAFVIANDIAPEHLELEIKDPEKYLDKVEYAGAVLLGKYSPEPLGDYIAGPNHTLPTSGAAKFASPLGVYDFLTKTSIIKYSEEDLRLVKDDIIRMSDGEGLTAHGNAVKIRFGELKRR